MFLLFSLFYTYHSFSNSFSRLTKQSYFYPSYDSYNYDTKWEKTQTIYYYISQARWCNRKHISFHVILPNKCILRKIEIQDYLANSFLFCFTQYLLFIMIDDTTRCDMYILILLYSGCTGYLTNLSHSLFYLLNMGVEHLIMRVDIKAAEVCSLRPIYYFIFRMLLTSDDSEAFFGWRWRWRWWWWW